VGILAVVDGENCFRGKGRKSNDDGERGKSVRMGKGSEFEMKAR
jgi:hypothetical protein